jgi:hypothetical protein
MGILGKIIGKSTDDIETPPCPHTSLSQRWDNLDDIGDRERATYECTSCGRIFTYEEVRNILEPGEPGREPDAAGAARFHGD